MTGWLLRNFWKMAPAAGRAFACVDDIETPSKFPAALLRQHMVLPVREHLHALPVSDK